MEVRSVAFSPDGRVLATGSCAEVPPSSFSCTQGETRLWDVAKGQAMDTLPGYANEVLSVAFSPDGKTLATTENDGTITLWDVPTREVLTHLVSGAGVEAPVWSAAFSPDTSQGILARTATRLGLRSRVEGPEGADKQILATGDNRGRVTLWDVSYESWQALACRMANRNMDEEEWSTNMGPDVDYQCTCDELPSGKANGSEATCEP
jgi:WD40 repeat protein